MATDLLSLSSSLTGGMPQPHSDGAVEGPVDAAGGGTGRSAVNIGRKLRYRISLIKTLRV